MKEEILNYCRSLGMADPFIFRVSTIIQLHEALSIEPFEDVFISEYIKEDGSRVYENLWLVSKTFVAEAKNFLAEDSLDRLPRGLIYWELRKRDYDLQKATQQSRLFIKLQFSREFVGLFKASGPNCDHLKSIFFKYFKNEVKQAP